MLVLIFFVGYHHAQWSERNYLLCWPWGNTKCVSPLSPESVCVTTHRNFNHIPGKPLAQMWPPCNFHTCLLHSWPTKDLVEILLMQDFLNRLSASLLNCTHAVLSETRLVNLAVWCLSPHSVATTNRELHLSGLSGNESLVTGLQSPVSTTINL